jgi:transcriptional regulator with XRE-family HTH domain
MSVPHVSPPRPPFSASRAVDVAGEKLREIKEAQNWTFDDLGEALGKGRDQAERYAKGNSVMDFTTFLRAAGEFGEAFADPLLAMVGLCTAPSRGNVPADPRGSLCLAKLLPAVLEFEADGIEAVEELQAAEELIRDVHRRTGAWLEKIAAAPALKVVGE